MALRWKKSSYSSATRTCVEIARSDRAVAARDSKNPDGGVLLFGAASWTSFLNGIRTGRFGGGDCAPVPQDRAIPGGVGRVGQTHRRSVVSAW
ncbi:DUF397 domain-containing protein [Saccharopolyspora gloriosae]|uniref:DUF397 domain-containing protein n=1 Tax=Saccharopolyspora gloriosae TaxID=455344 RepID=UPI00161EC121|nr:DUF397 domain-containing protein [Saccharopolyspora gloriosae]